MSSRRCYADRLRSLNMAEWTWRCRRMVRRAADRLLLHARTVRPGLRGLTRHYSNGFTYGNTAFASHHPEWKNAVRSACREDQRARLLNAAEALLTHRFDLFDRCNVFLGDDIHWNYEPKAEKRTPVGPSWAIDERDYRETGDARWVWEPNRHHHFVVLARAYFLTGDLRFAREVIAQTQTWITQCPYGRGMNWRRPLELAIRITNWAHAWELIRPSGLMTRDVEERVLPVVYQHLWEIQRDYSTHDSPCHRFLGEAAGVFIAGNYFSGFKACGRWCARARSILEREILRQTHDDGGHVEQSTAIHLFSLEWLLYAGLSARWSGHDFSSSYWSRVERMTQFIADLMEGGPLPMIGDADDSYVLKLGTAADRAAALLSLGATLFDRPDWASPTEDFDEPAVWLLARKHRRRSDSRGMEVATPLTSRALTTSGYYLLQTGHRGSRNAVSVLVDCGPLGHGRDAAHAHADALSLTLRIGGCDVLVDPGAFDSFTYPEWRDYFRSTRAHNTLVIDGENQSQSWGPFRWGCRAAARCLRWDACSGEPCMGGEHDGYATLSDPVIHRRFVSLQPTHTTVVVRDELVAKKQHEVSSFWHLGENCQASPIGEHAVRIDHPNGSVIMELARFFSIRLVRGIEHPPQGWISRGYHRRTPGLVIVAAARITGAGAWETRIVCRPTRTQERRGVESRRKRRVLRTTAS